MIIIKLTGGLGNQLFQYTKALSIAKSGGEKLLIDRGWYKGRISRKYMLDKYRISSRPANLFNIMITRLLYPNNHIDSSNSNDWQTYKYAEQVKFEIDKEFTLNTNLSTFSQKIMQEIMSSNSVSIHLRGGDYVIGNKSSFHGVSSKEYYSEAISIIKTKVIDPHFFIFTDDIKWAQSHIDFPKPFTLVSEGVGEPHEELFLMSKCKNNIIANSTFSWWGAWLNTNKDKVVITPQKWFNNSVFNIDELIPHGWIRI